MNIAVIALAAETTTSSTTTTTTTIECQYLTPAMLLGYIGVILLFFVIIEAIKILEAFIRGVESGQPAKEIVLQIRKTIFALIGFIIVWFLLVYIGADPIGAMNQIRCILQAGQ